MHKGPKHLTSTSSVRERHCSSDGLCPKCSLIVIVRYRFSAFRAKFGREPKPVEPLFFEPSKSVPVKASLLKARAQIEEAATAAGIDAEPVIRFLNLDSVEADRSGHQRGQVIAEPRDSRRTRSNQHSPKTTSVWEQFATDKRLHRLHRITRQELKTISSLAMMGQVHNSRDLLHILSLIRQSAQTAVGVENSLDKASH